MPIIVVKRNDFIIELLIKINYALICSLDYIN